VVPAGPGGDPATGDQAEVPAQVSGPAGGGSPPQANPVPSEEVRPEQTAAPSPPRAAVGEPGTAAVLSRAVAFVPVPGGVLAAVAAPAPEAPPAPDAPLTVVASPAATAPPAPTREESSSARGPQPLVSLAQVITGVLPDLVRRVQEEWGRRSEEEERLQQLAATLSERERTTAEASAAAERMVQRARLDAAAAVQLREQATDREAAVASRERALSQAEEGMRKRSEELASQAERLLQQEDAFQKAQEEWKARVQKEAEDFELRRS
jgi:hypothetical protein